MDKDQLKQVGLKITQPRVRVLSLLTSSDKTHWSAEAIYQELKQADDDIGLATVYRVLNQFEAAGLVQRHHFDDQHAIYELDNGQHHDHLVCVRCGQVEEFVDELIEQRQQEIAKELGYKIVGHSLYLYGECESIGVNGCCRKCGKNFKKDA